MAGEPASERSDLYALGVLLADVARDGADARALDADRSAARRDPTRAPSRAADGARRARARRPTPVGRADRSASTVDRRSPTALDGVGAGAVRADADRGRRSGAGGRARIVVLVAALRGGRGGGDRRCRPRARRPARTPQSGEAGATEAVGRRRPATRRQRRRRGRATDGPAATQRAGGPGARPETAAGHRRDGGAARPTARAQRPGLRARQPGSLRGGDPGARAARSTRCAAPATSDLQLRALQPRERLRRRRRATTRRSRCSRSGCSSTTASSATVAGGRSTRRLRRRRRRRPPADAKPGNGPKKPKVPPTFEAKPGDDQARAPGQTGAVPPGTRTRAAAISAAAELRRALLARTRSRPRRSRAVRPCSRCASASASSCSARPA